MGTDISFGLLITGGMLLLTLPILSGALLMVLADLHSINLWGRSYILSTLILVFWTSRSLYLNNSSIWDHKHNNYRNFTKNNLWEPINDLCHELYFSSWKCCLVMSRF